MFTKGEKMAKVINVSQVIDRPVEDVFRFFAVEHVRNHPRWDEDIKLNQVSEGPIGVGTIISRINTRSGKPVEGTVEVVEFETNRSFGVVVHDGPMEMRSRVLFEPATGNKTTISTMIEIPGMDENTDISFLLSRLERSAQIRKQLIETEINS
jgi:uncharacterized membrane protein